MEIYLVGGAVRDQLMGIKPKDFDYVVVGETHQSMIDAGFKRVGKDFPVYLDEDGTEYALARQERSTGSQTNDFVCTTDNVTLEEDLMRRDLTINAIAQNTRTGQYFDPFGGIKDIELKLFRHVSKAFTEDPVRVLRLARFSARYPDFNITSQTKQLVKQMGLDGLLDNLDKHRIFEEVRKVFLGENSVVFFTTLESLDVLKNVMYEVYNGYTDDTIINLASAFIDEEEGYNADYLMMVKTVSLLYNFDDPKSVLDCGWFKNKDVLIADRISKNLESIDIMNSYVPDYYRYFNNLKMGRNDYEYLGLIIKCANRFTLMDNGITKLKFNHYYELYNNALISLKDVDFGSKPFNISIVEFKEEHIIKTMWNQIKNQHISI